MADKIWYIRALIPLWVVQILISLIFVATAAIALWAVHDSNLDFESSLEYAVDTGAAVNLSFGIVTILLDVAEMILVCMGKLSPVTNIVSQSIKSAIWTVFLIVTIRAAAIGASSGLGIFLVIAIFLTCMGQLIYGATIMHRHRKGTLYRGNYTPADGSYAQNHSQFVETVGMSAPQPNPLQDPSHTALGYASQAPPGGASTEYYAPHHVQQSYEMQSNSRY